MVARGAGGHGEEAGGRPRQARSNGGGEAALALHGGGEPLFILFYFNPILHTWFRDSCFTCDGSSTIQVFPLLFKIGMVN